MTKLTYFTVVVEMGRPVRVTGFSTSAKSRIGTGPVDSTSDPATSLKPQLFYCIILCMHMRIYINILFLSRQINALIVQTYSIAVASRDLASLNPTFVRN